MAFDLHPILSAGQELAEKLWYAVSPEQGQEYTPAAKVGTCANFELLGGAQSGRVLLSAGATPEGPYPHLHQLTISKDCLKWARLPVGDFPARYEHASFLVGGAKGSVLYAFGGANQNGPLSDLWKYEKDTWHQVSTSGPAPKPRTLHTSTSYRASDHTLIVFGGGETGSNPVNDIKVHVLDIATSQWSSPDTTSPPPCPRQGHISAIVGDKLYIHGGMAGQEIFSDLHVLDLDKWVWSSPKVRGHSPQLAAHGCAVVGRIVYVYGGLSPSVGASDQLYCLNTDTLQWELVSTSGPPPPARLDHAMCTVMLPTATQGADGDTPSMEQQKVKGDQKTSPASAANKDSSTCSTPNTLTIISPDSIEQEDFALVTQTHPPTSSTASQSSHTADPSTCKASDSKPETSKDLNTTSSLCKANTADNVKSTDGPGAGVKDSAASDENSSNRLGTDSSRDVEKLSNGLESTRLDSQACAVSCEQAESTKSRGSGCEERVCLVPALFVYGGMDTSGHLHGDCFVFCPGTQ